MFFRFQMIALIILKSTNLTGNHTGCPRMFYTQKCKSLRIFITIKTNKFGILIYLSDRAVLLTFWIDRIKLKIHDIM